MKLKNIFHNPPKSKGWGRGKGGREEGGRGTRLHPQKAY